MAAASGIAAASRKRTWTTAFECFMKGAARRYEYWIDGTTNHCGIDSFDMVKVDGRWRVANAMWTVEPEGCPELRPADARAIRPQRP